MFCRGLRFGREGLGHKNVRFVSQEGIFFPGWCHDLALFKNDFVSVIIIACTMLQAITYQ